MHSVYKILVKIEKRFNDEVVTESGIRLYKDTTFKPEENSTIQGEVVSLPAKHDRKSYSDDFQFNVQLGDKLYFHYNVVLNWENCLEIDGQEVWMVDYFDAIAVVRDGKIIPVGSYILLEPVLEEMKSEFIIIPELAKTKEGNRGRVVASNDPEIPAGAEVEYEAVGKFWNVIEGKKLYCMYNSNILFIYGNSN
jgi:co-chaperonin GroES (HSP10)